MKIYDLRMYDLTIYLAIKSTDRQIVDRRYLTFLFVLFFFGRAQTRRRAQRLAVVEQRQIAHVERQHAPRRLLVDDDGDRAAFDAFTEGNAAAAGESRVGKAFQHRAQIISRGYSSDLI
jgi:hypothetical protein